MRRVRRSSVLVAGGLCAAAILAQAGSAATDSATQLALEYAPVVRLVEQAFNLDSLASGLIYVVTMPLVAIITTYLYFDPVVEETLQPSRTKRALVLPAEA